MASSIKKGAVISYVSVFLSIALTFFYTPWMIRQIGVSDYGLYNLILSFIGYFILDFGLSSAISRFIARYRAEGNEDKVAKMIGLTTRVYLIIDSVIFLTLFVLYFFISDIFKGLTPDEIEKLRGLYVIAGTFSVLSFMFKPMGGAMMAFEYFVEEKLLEMLNRVGAVVLVCVALSLGADVYALVLVNGAVSLLSSCLKFYVFRRKSKLKIQWLFFDKTELKNIFSFSVWTFIMGLVQRMRITLIPTVLGVVSNSHEIAVFSLAMSIEGMIYSFSHALNGLFLPKVTRMAIKGNHEEITDLMIRVGRLQLYIWGLLFSGFCVFGLQFLHLWVGADFHCSYYAIILVASPQLLSLTQQIATDTVYAENKIRHTTLLNLWTAVIGLLIAIPLAMIQGAVGAAIGTAIGLWICQFMLNRYYRYDLLLAIGRFLKNCHLKIVPFLTVFAIFCAYLLQFILIDSWLKLVIAIAAYTLLFLSLSYIFLFNREERSYIHLIRNIKK